MRFGVVYLNLVLSIASGSCFGNLSTVCGPHQHDPRFTYFIFKFFFLPDPWFSIPDPPSSILHSGFPVNLEALLIKIAIAPFFDHRSNKLFQSDQRFQAIEFVVRPVSEKPDMGFLFRWTSSAASRVRDNQVQSGYSYTVNSLSKTDTFGTGTKCPS